MIQKKEKEDLLKCDVKIKRKIFYKDGYGVFEVDLRNQHEVYGGIASRAEHNTTIVGNFDKEFHVNEEFTAYGSKTKHPRFGDQIKVQFVKAKFDSLGQVETFMRQFCQKSIVDQILDKYGTDVVSKIVNDEFDYSDIKGMGEHRFNILRTKVMENEFMATIIGALGDYGITPNQMKKVIQLFGASAIKKIKENPYNLCLVHGIGFMKADEVAKRMGFDPESPFRIHEAIKYVLNENQKSGHTWMNKNKLLVACVKLIDIVVGKIEKELPNVKDAYLPDNDRVTLGKTYNMEKYVGNKLYEIDKASEKLKIDVRKFLAKKREEDGFVMTEEQESLFYNFADHNLNFLIGNAGCGKSAIQKLVLDLADELEMTYLLLAPTGKASKQFEYYTGRKASTIHRAIGNGETNLLADVVIVDESSMVDIETLARLLSCIPIGTRVLFVGDDFQLPSVQCGAFLHDVIKSGRFNVTKLTKVFRQSEGGVLDLATKTRLKQYYVKSDFMGRLEYGKDCVLLSVPQEKMEETYLDCLNDALKHYSHDDIQILIPTKKGNLGTFVINNTVQGIVNPNDGMKKEVRVGYSVFREGDRVINIINNYHATNKEYEPATIYNGDMGKLVCVDDEGREVIVDYGFDQIRTSYDNLETLLHADAMTIHKSQGSGFPVVILILDKAHKFQMNANLLYTAYTRTKEKLYIVCQADVINTAMRKNESMARNTFLYEMLLEEANRNR